jgi:BCD family chlorophyll transporter-like MFS transporter
MTKQSNKVMQLLNVLRMALFPLSYGMIGALMGSTLNRVMIADIGFSALWVGLFFALPDLVAPVRIWLGYRSDGYPIGRKRREPYILLGALVVGLSMVLVTWLASSAEVNNAVMLLAIAFMFAVYGIGRNLEHNSWQALLSDRFEGQARSRAITGYEVATVFGLIAGAGIIGQLLGTYDAAQLMMVAVGLAAVAFVLAIIAVLGQEPQTAAIQASTARARDTSFGQTMREIVLADPQVRLFFVLVLFAFVGTLAQDVFLEPYGALVLGMDVGETTQLTVFWGLGLMVAMLLSGWVLVRWLGAMTVLRIGLIVSMIVFAGIIFTGATGNVGLFRGLVLVMGLGTGMAGAGMLTMVINFTSLLRAGLLLGVWGVANQLGRATGSLMGGGVVASVQGLTGETFTAYAAVFALEIGMLLVALLLSFRLHIESSRAKEEEVAAVGTLVSGN